MSDGTEPLFDEMVIFLPEASIGLRVLSVLRLSVRPSVHKFVRAITQSPVQGRIIKFGP